MERHELLAADKLYQSILTPTHPDNRILVDHPKRAANSKHTNDPLDVQKLQAIAALARQIQSRPRRA
jgi:hypothetical protein